MDWVQLFRDVGFPALVALILLLKLDHTINALRDSIEENNKLLRMFLRTEGRYGMREEDKDGGKTP